MRTYFAKRQNADIANAAAAYSRAYLPCLLLLSRQIDQDILARYRAAQWVVLTGMMGDASPQVSTYAFMREVIGYDWASFFARQATTRQTEVQSALEALLRTE